MHTIPSKLQHLTHPPPPHRHTLNLQNQQPPPPRQMTIHPLLPPQRRRPSSLRELPSLSLIFISTTISFLLFAILSSAAIYPTQIPQNTAFLTPLNLSPSPRTPTHSPTPKKTPENAVKPAFTLRNASISSVVSREADAPASTRATLSEGRWKFTRTKQISTIGPSSNSFETIEALFLSGADIFRLNFSHGRHEEKLKIIDIIRTIEAKWNHPIAIMADLQGPKLRIGRFERGEEEGGEVGQKAGITSPTKDGKPIYLKEGDHFTLDSSPLPGDQTRVHLPHPEVLGALRDNDVLLLDDGKLKLRVIEHSPYRVKTVVEQGGPLSDNKGINTPTCSLPISAMSEKDKEDAAFAVKNGVDLVALSFVQSAEDLQQLRKITGPGVGIVAKIEKPAAVSQIDGIIEAADGVMIARGDLGIEMNIEEVPVVQKTLIKKCRQEGKPVIVATQMLESMVSNPTPTRAEASDVATAIYDGADAVMLSGESAAGKYPIQSVVMQQRIIDRVERDPYYWLLQKSRLLEPEETTVDAISSAVRGVSEVINAKAIVSFSVYGHTVGKISASRPDAPILAVTPSKETARRLQLYWGVYPITDPLSGSVEEGAMERVFQRGCKLAVKEGMVSSPDDSVVLTAGVPIGRHNTTSLLHVCKPSEMGLM